MTRTVNGTDSRHTLFLEYSRLGICALFIYAFLISCRMHFYSFLFIAGAFSLHAVYCTELRRSVSPLRVVVRARFLCRFASCAFAYYQCVRCTRLRLVPFFLSLHNALYVGANCFPVSFVLYILLSLGRFRSLIIIPVFTALVSSRDKLKRMLLAV